jgi:hypothetical protein
MSTSYNSQLTANIAELEYSKFVRIDNDSRFAPLSVVRTAPYSTAAHPLTSMDIYPKYAMVTYLANADDISVTLNTNNLNIGSVSLKDGNSGALADIESVNSKNALCVTRMGTAAVSGVVNSGVAKATDWGVTFVSAGSAAYTRFPSNIASSISYVNNTGSTVFVGKFDVNGVVGIPLANNASIDINLVGNTNEFAVKTTLSTIVTTFAVYTNWS